MVCKALSVPASTWKWTRFHFDSGCSGLPIGQGWRLDTAVGSPALRFRRAGLCPTVAKSATATAQAPADRLRAPDRRAGAVPRAAADSALGSGAGRRRAGAVDALLCGGRPLALASPSLYPRRTPDEASPNLGRGGVSGIGYGEPGRWLSSVRSSSGPKYLDATQRGRTRRDARSKPRLLERFDQRRIAREQMNRHLPRISRPQPPPVADDRPTPAATRSPARTGADSLPAPPGCSGRFAGKAEASSRPSSRWFSSTASATTTAAVGGASKRSSPVDGAVAARTAHGC